MFVPERSIIPTENTKRLEKYCRTPLLFLTGNGTDDILDAAFAAAATALLLKFHSERAVPIRSIKDSGRVYTLGPP